MALIGAFAHGPPVTPVGWGALLPGWRLTVGFLAGFALVLVGVLLATRPESGRRGGPAAR